MKKLGFCLAITMICLLVTACAWGGEQRDDVISAYQRVIAGERTLVSEGKPVSLIEAASSISGVEGATPVLKELAIVDVDADGMLEVIIAVDLEGIEYFGFLVLDWEGGTVYGYGFGYRAMTELKADGSFSFSSGADDGGFGFADFENHLPEIASMAYSEMQTDGSVAFHVNGEVVSEEVFTQAIRVQYAKEEAKWFPFDSADLFEIAKQQ